MGIFKNFVEWGTDAKYVAPGKKCDICGKKLGLLETGFWSINAKQLADGVLCRHCFEKLEKLREYRKLWVPRSLHKTAPFCYLEGRKLLQMNVQKARQLLGAAETLAGEELAAIGPDLRSVFRMAEACFIEPTALQVGVQRAKLLNGKLVLFGFVQLGQFQKGDRVLILDGENKRESTILEAYIYDSDVPENDLEVMLRANMGKQCLKRFQTGWLVLEDESKVADNASVVG